MLQTGTKTITKTYCPISQKVKVIRQKLSVDIFFSKNHAENEAGRPVPDLFLFLKKLYKKQVQLHLTPSI